MHIANALSPAHSCVVVDSIILLNEALSPNSAQAPLVNRLLTDAQIGFSKQTFAELKLRLWKPKFDRCITMERRHSLLHDFNAVAVWVDVSAQIASLRYSRDSTDDAFIRAALAAGALLLVTDGENLLCFDPIANVELRIVTPRRASIETYQ